MDGEAPGSVEPRQPASAAACEIRRGSGCSRNARLGLRSLSHPGARTEIAMAPAPANTRRWQRHQVKLPVRIIAPNDTSEITVPGLTTEISQGGMALYGGVPLQPGDLMAVEFQTSSRLRVAALIRDRYGYCFGLEFLGLLPNDGAQLAAPDFSQITGEPDILAEAEQLVVGATGSPATEPVQLTGQEDEILALFMKRHEAYLHQKDLELKRLRYEIHEIRQSRREIETLLLRQVLGRSG